MRILPLSQSLSRFRQKDSGNVVMTFALAAPVLVFGVAFAIDFANHTIVESKLQAAADAAALAALTPAMLQQSASVAQAAATAMFNARAATVTTLISGQTQVAVTVTTSPANPLERDVTVNYSAEASTIMLNIVSMGVQGSSSAKASVPPNIDFYLLLDNSPSMQLPATQAGLNLMQQLTPLQDPSGGQSNSCAFACHQASTNNADTLGNPCSDGSSPTVTFSYTQSVNNQNVTYTIPNASCPAQNANGQAITQIDNFALARQNNITLRLDELASGVTTLMQTAHNYQTSGTWAAPPTYRFAAYEMDLPWEVGTTNNLVMGLTSNYQSVWSASSANFGVMEMYANNFECADAACDSGVSFNDVATNYDVAMSDINANMPSPGNGSKQSGDKPQEVMFFVTDGVEDESSGGRLIQTINGAGSTDYCSVIKGRGIKIAVLYTEYLQVPANAFYEQYVAPIQPNIASSLQACASPGLFVDASIGDNLGQDLATLFQLSVQAATLSN